MSSPDESFLRPRPLQPFTLSSDTSELSTDSQPTSPCLVSHDGQQSPSSPGPTVDDSTLPPSRTRSILNLTSSTLLGIYSRTGYAPDRDDAGGGTTPWGTGAETPHSVDDGRSRAGSSQGLGIEAGSAPPTPSTSGWGDKLARSRRRSVLDESAGRSRNRSKAVVGEAKNVRETVGKSVALAGVGLCYGLLISHLHDERGLAPVRVEGFGHYSVAYLACWAGVAVVLGEAMPWADGLWEQAGGKQHDGGMSGAGGRKSQSRERMERRRGWSPEWNDVVRSIGLFVGIAFAIRRLPWQSTLQLSLTLALSNPAVWYLLDRTISGFAFSTVVAISGTALCLAVNPNLIPAPGSQAAQAVGSSGNATGAAAQGAGLVAGVISQESVGVATWIASVLFVSCVCFGNIGRRL